MAWVINQEMPPAARAETRSCSRPGPSRSMSISGPLRSGRERRTNSSKPSTTWSPRRAICAAKRTIPSSKKVKFVFRPASFPLPRHEAEVLKVLLNAETVEL